ncbi:TIMP metallopeptidase inhibitor 4 [Mactra antiquata]
MARSDMVISCIQGTMATSSLKLLLPVLVLACLFQFGYGCSCYPESLKDLYCRATFVAKFKILSTLQVPKQDNTDYYNYNFDQDGYYRVRMARRTWKFPEQDNVNKRRLYTPASGGMCGLYLSPGEVYVISGRISSDGTMYVAMCSSIAERTPVSGKLRRWRRNPPQC